jgi:hypothetical protein
MNCEDIELKIGGVELTKNQEKFNMELGNYIKGPEHNSYYDLSDICQIIIEQLTDSQIKKIMKRIRKEKK